MTLTMIVILFDALITFIKGLEKTLEELEFRGKMKTSKTAKMVKSVRISGRFPGTWVDLHSLSIQNKTQTKPTDFNCPVGWDSRIHRQHLNRVVRFPTPASVHDITLKNLIALEIWGMKSTHSLPLLSGPLWFGVVVSDRVLSMSQIESLDWSNWMHTNDWCLIKLLLIHSTTRNHLIFALC